MENFEEYLGAFGVKVQNVWLGGNNIASERWHQYKIDSVVLHHKRSGVYIILYSHTSKTLFLALRNRFGYHNA